MKKMMIVLAVPVMVVTALVVLEVSGGCGLLDAADEIWIVLPAQTFDFELDANQLRPLLEARLGVSLAGMTEFPPQVPDNIQETLELETPPEQIDLTNEEKLKDYVSASKVKSVKIESVKYNITRNDFNYNLPEMKMFMDNHGATGITASSQLVATVPPIQANTTGNGEVQWAPNGRDIMSDYLMSFKFAILGQAILEIDTSKNRKIPAGVLTGQVEVVMKFSVDPI